MNRNDRRVAIAALAVGALALVGIWLTDGDQEATRHVQPLESRTAHSGKPRSTPYFAVASQKVERFDFDPNTADSTQLLRLGLQAWQVRNIYRYRAKGGIYRRKEDFAKLYGLTVKQYRELEPYIHISSDYQPASTLFADSRTKEKNGQQASFERDTLRYPVKIKEGEHIVLNMADTAQLKKVPGIGTYYAKEILRYGQWLGGYVSVDQLDEIEGLPQETKKYFIVQSPNPKRLNVNRLPLSQLRRHPYINYYQAKAITDYRRLHGPLKSLDELSLLPDFPPETIERLKPYVEY